MPCLCGGLSLGVPPSSLAWGSFDQSLQRQRVQIGGLVLGHSDGLLSGMCGLFFVCLFVVVVVFFVVFFLGVGRRSLCQSPSAIYLALSTVWGIAGDALRMLNQNRHQ